MDKENVLVIADSARSRAAMSDLLARAGYRVFELPSAIGATRNILRNDVQAVVVDVSDRGTSGEKLVQMLRGTARLCNLVVILVSAAEQAELSRLEATSEADGVLSRGEVTSSLPRTLQHVLSMRRLDRSLELISALPA